VADVVLAAAKWPCEQTIAGFNLGVLVCTPLETALAVAKQLLEVPKFCDATVDEAHLDAAFERAEDNYDLGLVIHGDLALHDGDLAQHDADLKALLAQHDTDIKAILASMLATIAGNQFEIIRLLNTPTGRRETTVAACDGGPCDFPDK
jgi:hypothetical protein